MVANIRGYTPNYNFKLINFDTPRWHTLEYDNWNMLDNMFGLLSVAPIRGDWTNSTAYIPGERVFDPISGELYRCLITHTSATTGTFEADRIARPTLWTLQLGGVPVYRGNWLPTTQYAQGDIVVVGAYDYYLCTINHLSTGDFNTDSFTKWQMVFSATQVMTDATTAKDAAADSATDAANSAAAADISEAAAAGSANDAQASADSAQDSAVTASNTQGAFRWLFEHQNVSPPGVGGVRVNNATPSSVTAVFIHAQTADVGNPDVSNWIITWDDSTNTQSKGTVYVRNAVDPENFFIFNITGAAVIVDNGTWLEVPVVYVTHAGSFAAGTVLSVAFTRAGNDGVSGTGTGDMLRAANLSDVISVPTSRTNLGLGTSDTPTFNQVTVAIAPTVDMHVATKKYVDDLPDPPPPLMVQPTPPSIATTEDNAMWWDNDNGVLYVLYNDGDSRQWVQAVALPVVDLAGFVQKTGDTMSGLLALSGDPTLALHGATKQYVDGKVTTINNNIVAHDARRNRIVNGAMQISQENGNNVVATAAYPADQWLFNYVSSSSMVSQRSGPFGGGADQIYAISIASTPVDTSATAAEYAQLATIIEGSNVADFFLGTASSRQFILAFDVYVGTAGTYWVSFSTVTASHSYLASYSISAGEISTWVRRQIVVPAGAIPAGTFSTTNTGSLYIHFTFHCGPTLTGVAGFQTGNFLAGPGQALGLSATTCAISNVGLYLDVDNTGIAPKWETPDLAQELLRCQRYWNFWYALLVPGNAPATGIVYNSYPISPHMRQTPAVTFGTPAYGNASALQLHQANLNAVTLRVTIAASGYGYGAANTYLNARM